MNSKCLILFVILLIVEHSFSSRRCTFVYDTQNSNEFVECTNVGSIADLSNEVESTWGNLTIKNPKDSTFYLTEQPRKLFAKTEFLDLSEAGKIILSDHGFKDFELLKHLILSNAELNTIKISWFLSNNQIESFDMSRNRIATLNRVDLRNLNKMNNFNLAHNYLANIQVNTFADMRNLETLNLSFNLLKTIDLGDSSTLKILDLSENLITIIPSNAFTGMANLETLTVAQNYIDKIEDQAFTGLSNLKYLNISGNSLEILREQMFTGLSRTRLIILDLSENDITTLTANCFNQLPLLQTLNLSMNSISQLNANSFIGLRAIRKLFLNDNNIKNLPDSIFETVPTIEILELSGNSLQTLSDKIFGQSGIKLKKFMLNRNNLMVLHENLFVCTPNIIYLSLAHNSITSFHPNLFKPLQRLEKFHFGHNLIEELLTEHVNHLYNLSELLLDHNRLTFFPDVNNTFPRLRKAAIEGNPWQCPCFDILITFFDTRKIDYWRKFYYDGQKPVCVVTPVKACVKDIELVRQHGIVESFESYE